MVREFLVTIGWNSRISYYIDSVYVLCKDFIFKVDARKY